MDENKSEISLGAALFLLGAFCIGYFYFRNKETAMSALDSVQQLYHRNPGYWMTLSGLGSINSLWVIAILVRWSGVRGQGARLKVLHEPNTTKGMAGKDFGKLLGAGALGGLLALSLTGSFLRAPISEWTVALNVAFVLQFVLIVALLGSRLGLLSTMRKIIANFEHPLPPIPIETNHVVLGTVGEDLPRGQAEWKTVNRIALNHGVLITGSIGSGKSQGAILEYMAQMLTNFSPRPAVLAIDPKLTFVHRAKEIAIAHKLEKSLRVLSLDGKETFNPVWAPDMLKDSKISEIAEMLRAAGSNFIGQTKESSFWEENSFSLMKNVLVYCAVRYGYFTMNDLYTTILSASSEPLATDLTEALKGPIRFSKEESFNIEGAIEYFTKQYGTLDEKIRSSIMITATTFLNQFQDFRASKVFCPPLKESATIQSFDDLIDRSQILLVDIDVEKLARSMGTIVKQCFQKAVLARNGSSTRSKAVPAVLICDEFQDVVTTGGGRGLGDDRFQAKCREANAIFIVATQSLSSLKNTLKSQDASNELLQNFRTHILCNSIDEATTKNYERLIGKEDIEKVSHGYSETSQSPVRNLVLGGFDSPQANISESVHVGIHREYKVTAADLARLTSYEAQAMIYDGTNTEFTKLYLKPEFLDSKRVTHQQVLAMVRKQHKTILKAASTISAVVLLIMAQGALAFPSICEVVKQPQFRDCLDWMTTTVTCGVPPHPCAQISYWVPQTYLETTVAKGLSHFTTYPGASGQLASLPKMPYGVSSDDDSQSLQARSIAIPFTSIAFAGMPCDGARMPKLCFDAMSEHFGRHWDTGSGDLNQPAFLAWRASPKLCLMTGAVGAVSSLFAGDSAMCSIRLGAGLSLPPSQLPVCTPWGIMFPRYGTIEGPSDITGALAIAERIKSLSVEVLHSSPSSPGEKWQMISPSSSRCFLEYEHVPSLQTIKMVHNGSRMMAKDLQGNLVATWKRVSCVKEWAEVPFYQAQIAMIQSICQGMK